MYTFPHLPHYHATLPHHTTTPHHNTILPHHTTTPHYHTTPQYLTTLLHHTTTPHYHTTLPHHTTSPHYYTTLLHTSSSGLIFVLSSYTLLKRSLPLCFMKARRVSLHSSIASDRTFVMCTPRDRCTPEHCRQSVIPKLMEAHSGFLVAQSAQQVLPVIMQQQCNKCVRACVCVCDVTT